MNINTVSRYSKMDPSYRCKSAWITVTNSPMYNSARATKTSIPAFFSSTLHLPIVKYNQSTIHAHQQLVVAPCQWSKVLKCMIRTSKILLQTISTLRYQGMISSSDKYWFIYVCDEPCFIQTLKISFALLCAMRPQATCCNSAEVFGHQTSSTANSRDSHCPQYSS